VAVEGWLFDAVADLEDLEPEPAVMLDRSAI
jgi:hypothetical protein